MQTHCRANPIVLQHRGRRSVEGGGGGRDWGHRLPRSGAPPEIPAGAVNPVGVSVPGIGRGAGGPVAYPQMPSRCKNQKPGGSECRHFQNSRERPAITPWLLYSCNPMFDVFFSNE